MPNIKVVNYVSPFLLLLLRGELTLRGIGPLLLVRSIKDAWRAHTVLGAAEGEESLGVVLRPTTITNGHGVFPLAGGSDVSYEGGCWREDGLELKLVVGDATNPTGGKRSGRIECGDPKPLSKRMPSASHEGDWTEFIASGGSGVVMEDGTLVFPLMAMSEAEDVCSMIICSTDSGSAWALSEDVSPAECLNPASPSGRDHFTWLLTARVARGCRRRVTWDSVGGGHRDTLSRVGQRTIGSLSEGKPACGCPHHRDH
ncbi:trans-sialidase [Trypanosoma cruzi Dm28c]|uniref:Trans-sialidase n=1 Tax=Trypanosoma cruzi Dm28c TaxID=1416333 RepID=V5D751_TRYCR|nr:trans-sialidase [Trypanosoma cruzi Dm28c]